MATQGDISLTAMSFDVELAADREDFEVDLTLNIQLSTPEESGLQS